MGDQTLAEFRDDIVLKLGNRTDVDLTDERLTRWVNDAYIKLAKPSVRQFPELLFKFGITLVQDQSEYDISETAMGHKFLGIFDLIYYNATGVNLGVGTRQHKLRPRSMRRLDHNTTHNAEPRYYSTELGGATSNILTMYPIPGAAENGKRMLMRYWGQPTKLVDGTDTTVLPSEYDASLRFGAQAVAMMALPGYDAEALEMMRAFQVWANDGTDANTMSADDWGHRADVISRSYQESGFNS